MNGWMDPPAAFVNPSSLHNASTSLRMAGAARP
jgi:hypothetical protein